MGAGAPMAEDQRRVLARLSRIVRERGLYLAGGVAVAHHLGHRRSRDLDFFSGTSELELESLRAEILATDAGARVLSVSDASLRLVSQGVPIDVVRYPYPTLEPARDELEGVPVAGLRDLAAMKLAAISRRGLRRDFWDLHEIADRALDLDAALAAYRARFGTAEADEYHVLRALTWFEDAEADPIWPEGLVESKWHQIRKDLQRWATELLKG